MVSIDRLRTRSPSAALQETKGPRGTRQGSGATIIFSRTRQRDKRSHRRAGNKNPGAAHQMIESAAESQDRPHRAVNTSFVDAARTARTATATPGRHGRRIGSARTGGIMRRSPIFQCTFIISAGRFGRCGSKTSRDAGGNRSPAMAAGLADHVWSTSEWLTLPQLCGE